MRRDMHGVSLLEAIVALAIFAAAGLALFAAMSQSVRMLDRADRARRIDAAMRNGLAVVQALDLMRDTRGEAPIGDFQLRWTATPLEAPRPGATGYLQPGYFDIGLYSVRMELWRDGRLENVADVRRVAYRQARHPAGL